MTPPASFARALLLRRLLRHPARAVHAPGRRRRVRRRRGDGDEGPGQPGSAQDPRAGGAARPRGRRPARPLPAAHPPRLGHRPGREDLPLDGGGRGGRGAARRHAPALPVAARLPRLARRAAAGPRGAHGRHRRVREHVPGERGRAPASRSTRTRTWTNSTGSTTSCWTPAMPPSPATTCSRSAAASATVSGTCTCPTTPARDGTPTCRPGRVSWPLDEFLIDLAGAGYGGAVTLEVDLRRQADRRRARSAASWWRCASGWSAVLIVRRREPASHRC